MDITFFIGNGFDLKIGLKTKYSDFYNYLHEIKSDSDLYKCIDANREKWADCELGLGQHTENFESIEEFSQTYISLSSDLIDYLKEEQEKFKIVDKTLLAKSFALQIKNLKNGLTDQEKIEIDNIFHGFNGTINYNFITLNYTDILDQIIDETINQKADCGNHVYGNTGYNNIVTKPFHVHGTLVGNDLLFGVYDESQIANEKFRADQEFKTRFIKQLANASLGNLYIEKAKKIVDGSMVICMFGLSYGLTDTFWWDYIAKWLASDKNRRLILFSYSQNKENRNITTFEEISNRGIAKNEFCDNVDVSLINNQIKSQIIVQRASSIFNLEGFNIEK